MAFPIAKVVTPTDLHGADNGNLPDHLLVTPGWPLRPKARMHRVAAAAFQQLFDEVHARFGETLTAVSTHDAYRHYGVQEACFTSRYSPTPIAGCKTKTWNGRTYWQKPNTAMAGVPGTSNHGWGLALDTAIVRNGQVVGILANREMFAWLLTHAAAFGISWEVQSEPWHLRYLAGDNLPGRVADRLATDPITAQIPITPSAPAPAAASQPALEEDFDMAFIITNSGTGEIALVYGDRQIVGLAGGDLPGYVARFGEPIPTDPVIWQGFLDKSNA